MELRHLEYFLAVAEERSFTRAARRLHVVQSGVSSSVRALERELGAELFSRAGRRVALTGAGEALLPEARATLDAAAAARDAVQLARGGLRGTVAVGSLIALELVDLPALLGEYHRTHPGVDLRLRTAPSGSRGLAEALRAGTLDLAFLTVPPGYGGLDSRVIVEMPIQLVVPAGHRLAGAGPVSLDQLADEEFVDFPAGYGNRDVVDRAFAAIGVERRRSLEVADTTTTARFVREGLGVALLPAYAVPPPDDPDLAVLPLAGEPLRWTMSVATHAARRPTAATRALLDLIDTHHP